MGYPLSREESQYTATDDARDAGVISWLIDVLLLGRPAAWPDSGLGPLAPLEQWSTTGRAMLAHDTDGSAAGKLSEALEKARPLPSKPPTNAASTPRR